jgi:heme/copper-type cytochrome/quinol oxidase subunit 1
LFCGFLVGSLGNRGFFRNTLAMGVFLSVISTIVHWLAGSLGVRVDFGAVSWSAMIFLIAMPIWIGLSMLGGVLGLLVRSLVDRRKYHGLGPHEAP